MVSVRRESGHSPAVHFAQAHKVVIKVSGQAVSSSGSLTMEESAFKLILDVGRILLAVDGRWSVGLGS